VNGDSSHNTEVLCLTEDSRSRLTEVLGDVPKGDTQFCGVSQSDASLITQSMAPKIILRRLFKMANKPGPQPDVKYCPKCKARLKNVPTSNGE